MNAQDTKPLVLMNVNKEVVKVLTMNEKGFRKSLENDVLWVLHDTTGRLLPLEGEPPFKDLVEKDEFYTAILIENNTNVSHQDEVTFDTPDVLDRLWQVIQHRNEARPEGSYTTHLFEKGVEKIKKKLGEEAVEVILANNAKEITYESADLIYHLFVLLTATNVSLESVYLELANRAK
ncbi:phosphoribosyl-ATP diphosphatase [Spirochaeta cellobiosiphila]|uniref:phosphoribosyl-ATP diphosphatase n=1 Tax=Spirochaeta cellobiosiphila TaxID=504483 RepID=UPI0004071FCE|nr:phosphoribosyl-ATP diphosphatase [Spirochaeta cellobiosiphila]